MATFRDGTEAKDGNIVRGRADTGQIVQGMLSDIRADGTGTVTWLTSEDGKDGSTHISADSTNLRLSECEKLAETFLSDLAANNSSTAEVEQNDSRNAAEPSRFSEAAGCLFRGRLTKAVVMGLQEGSVVSKQHVPRTIGRRKAVEVVGNLEDREEFWKRLRPLGITNSTCNVFRDRAAYQRSVRRWEKAFPRPEESGEPTKHPIFGASLTKKALTELADGVFLYSKRHASRWHAVDRRDDRKLGKSRGAMANVSAGCGCIVPAFMPIVMRRHTAQP